MTALEEARTADPVTAVEPDPVEVRGRRRGLVGAALGGVLVAIGAGAWVSL